MNLSRIADRPLARLRASLTRYGRRRFAPSLTRSSTRTETLSKRSRPLSLRSQEHQLHFKARSDFRRYRLRFDLRRIDRVARRPDARFLALDRERAVHQQLMLD